MDRTQAKNLADLKAGILELMGIAYPLIVSSDMRLIGGRGRLEALRQLFDCLHHKGDMHVSV